MTPLTATYSSAGGAGLFYIGLFDFAGDPVRATTFPGGIVFGPAATGDPDLDGYSFIHIPSALVSVGGVTHQTGGADALNVELSGLPGANDDLLAEIGATANWQGRTGRLWHGVHDGMGGAVMIAPYYTGHMMAAQISGDPAGGMRINLTLESYLAALSEARGRSYQDQGLYDTDDKSPARIRASANGVKGAGGASFGGSGGGGGQRDVLPGYDLL